MQCRKRPGVTPSYKEYSMHRLLVACVACGLIPSGAAAQTTPEVDGEVAEDAAFLKEANVRTDGPGLLAYLRKQTLKDDEQQQITAIVKKLDGKSFQTREKAAAELIAVGPKALPVLRGALQGATLEMRMRIERCIKELEKQSPALIASAVVRLVKHHRPPGAGKVLLAYLTSAPDDSVEEEILVALPLVAVTNGQPDPTFEPALTDRSPGKRAAAALVLGRFGSRNQRATVHLLLDDPHPAVRLRAAQGLVLGRDKSAIPALIALLVKTPQTVGEQAEDILLEVAGPTAPQVALGEDANSRTTCFKAWRDWWQLHQTKINLARTDLDTLASNDGTGKARVVARQFMLAIFKGDKPAIHKTSDLPFVIAGVERIESREAWDLLVVQIPQDPRNQETKFTVQKVLSLEQYTKTAPQEERAFIDKMLARKAMTVRVVLGLLQEGGQNRLEQFSVFVRVNGARARVVGIGVPRGGAEKLEAK
jgi:hypothetical protein